MTHHSDAQQRTPSGHPDGGEFSASASAPAAFDVRELPDDEYNADGSFEYPPPPRSADQVLAFWMSVPVPDVILENLQYTFEKRAEQITRENEDVPGTVRACWHEGFRVYDEWVDKGGIEAAIAAEQEIADRPRPVTMADADVRTLVRAAQAYHQAQLLPDEEREKVEQHRLFLHSHTDVEVWIGRAERNYRLNTFRSGGAFKDPTRWVGNQISKMARDLEASVDRSRLPLTADEHQAALSRHGYVELPPEKGRNRRR